MRRLVPIYRQLITHASPTMLTISMRRISIRSGLCSPEEVKLDLVNRKQLSGKAEVSGHFSNYSKINDWRLVPGLVESQPAILVFDPTGPGSKPKYFILLGWSAGKIVTIRDFRHASYVAEEADILLD